MTNHSNTDQLETGAICPLPQTPWSTQKSRLSEIGTDSRINIFCDMFHMRTVLHNSRDHTLWIQKIQSCPDLHWAALHQVDIKFLLWQFSRTQNVWMSIKTEFISLEWTKQGFTSTEVPEWWKYYISNTRCQCQTVLRHSKWKWMEC